MVLPIVTGSANPVLRTKTKNVVTITKELLKLLKNMRETTENADGLGIAAPQVGNDWRVCVAKIHGTLTTLVNPDILWKSGETEWMEEGCLSLPGIWVPVPRSKEIVVRYMDERGEKKERKLTDLDARVVQHEVDHLEGILIVDYLAKKEGAEHKEANANT